MPNTIRLHRVIRATPERVYRAFLDLDARASTVVVAINAQLLKWVEL